MSPYIAYLIVQTGNYPWALAAFGYAGITDLVSYFVFIHLVFLQKTVIDTGLIKNFAIDAKMIAICIINR